MSTVTESRVVEMRFDNQQFEQAAKETLNTLDQLKQALDNGVNGSAFDELDRAARSVDLSGIEAGIEALTDRFSTMGIVGMTVIQNLTNAITNTLGHALSSISDSIISGGMRRAQNIENALFQLQGMLDTEEEVTEVMNNASAAVDGTAYSLDAAAKAASQFAASGVQAGEEMTQALTAISGIAATTSSEYEDISRIFTTVAGNGRLMGDQLLQLSNRGLNAAAALKDYFNGVRDGSVEATEATKELVESIVGPGGSGETVAMSTEEIKKAADEQYKLAKKAADAEYNAKKKTYDKEYKALQKALNNEYNLKKAEYDKQYKALQESLSAEVSAVQEANTNRINELNDAYQKDVEAYRESTNQKIELINQEYTESIKLIDEERYNKIKAIDEQIKALQNQTKQETRSAQETADAKKKAALEAALANAKGSVTIQKAQEALATLENDISKRNLSNQRQDQITSLQEQKTQINNEASLQKQAAAEKKTAATKAVNDESNAKLKEMQKTHTEELNAIRKQQQEQIKVMQQTNSERLAAMRTQQNEELATMKEGQTLQLEAKREFQNEELSNMREAQQDELALLKESLSEQAKAVGKFHTSAALTEADIRDMVSEGLISFDLFSEAMATTFGEHAFDANKTFQGAMSNIRSALARTGAMFITPLIQQGSPLIDLLNAIRTKINEVNKVLQPIADIVTGAINSWIPSLTRKINDLYISLSYTTQTGEEIGKQVTLFGPIGQTIGNVLKGLLNIFSALASYIKPVIQAFKEVFTLDFGAVRKGSENFEAFTKTLKASDKATSAIRSTFKAVFTVIKSLVTIVTSLFKAFSPLTQLFGLAGDSIGGLAKNIADAITNFTTWIATSEKMQKIFSTLTGYVQSFVNVVKKVKDAVSDAFEASFNFTKIGSYFSEGFLEGMKSLIPDVLKGILDFGKNVLKNIKEVFGIHSPSTEMFEIGINFVQGFINAIVYMVQTILTVVGSAFRTVLDNVKQILSDVDFQAMVLNGLETARSFVENVIKGIKDKIPDAVEAVKDFFASIAEKVQEWRSGADTGISFMRKFLEGCWSVLQEILTGIGEIFGEIISSIREKFEDFSIKDAVITGGTFALNFVKGLKDKLVEISGDILTTLKNTFEPLSAAIPSIIAIAAGFGVLFTLIKLANALKKVVSPFAAIGGAIDNLSKALKAYAFDLKATAILKISAALAILVGAVWGLVELIDKYGGGKVAGAVVALLGIAVALELAFIGFADVIAASKTVESGLNSAATGLGKAFKRFSMGSLIKSFAKSIMTLVLSITILATMISTNKEAVDEAIVYISLYLGILGALAGLVAVAEMYGVELSEGVKLFSNMGKAVLGMALGVYIVVGALEKILDLDLQGKEKNIKLLNKICFGIFAAIALFLAESASLGKDDEAASAPLMTLIGFAILLNTTIKALEKVLKIDLEGKEEQLKLMKNIFIGVGVLMAVIMFISSMGDGGMKAGGTILAMSVFLLAAVASIKSLVKTIEGTDVGTMVGAIVSLVVVILAMSFAFAMMDGMESNGWKSILAMTASLGVIILGLGALSLIKTEQLIPAAVGLALCIAALGAAFYGAGQIKDNKGTLKMLALIAAAIGMGFLLMKMSEFDWAGILASGVALGVVILAYAKAFQLIASANPEWSTILKFITGSLALVFIGGALALAATQDWASILAAGASLAAVIYIYASAFKMMSGITVDTSTVGNFVLGSLSFIIIGAMLAIVATQDWASILAAGGAMSLVIGVYALAFKALSDVHVDTGTIGNFLLGSLSIIIIGAMLAVVATQNWESILAAGGAISLVLAAYTLCFGAINKIEVDFKSMGAFLAGIVGVIAIGLIIGELAQYDWKSLMGASIAIITTLLGMAVVLLITSLVGELGTAALTGIGILDAFIANLAVVLVALGALTKIEGFTDLIAAGGGVLVQIGTALGNFVGSIVEGALVQISDSFPKIGQNLADFMTNAKPFFDALGNFDEGTAKAAGAIAGVILALGAAELMDAVSNFLSIFTGNKDASSFGEKLASFGTSLATFAKNTNGVNGDNLEKVAEGGKALIEMANAIPNEGGWLAKIVGDNDIGTFGVKLAAFSMSLKLVAANLAGVDVSHFPEIAESMKSMITMATSIPNSGGWLGAVVGNNDIDDFGTRLVKFSMSLMMVDQALKGVPINKTRFQNIADSMEIMIKMATSIPNSGGWLGAIVGNNDIDDFGKRLSVFSMHLRVVSTNLSGVNSTQMTNVADSMKEMITVAKAVKDNGLGKGGWFGKDSALEEFGKNLVGFGEQIRILVTDKLPQVDRINTLTGNLNKFIMLIPILNTFTGEGFTKFLKDLGDYGDQGLKKFCNAFENSKDSIVKSVATMFSNISEAVNSKKELMEGYGRITAGYFSDGVRSDESARKVSDALKAMISNSLDNEEIKRRMEPAGRYAVEGFVRGIRDNMRDARDVGRDLGNAAYDAARKALDEHSPSRKMAQVGSFAGEGFVEGFLDWVKAATNAGGEIGESAQDGLRNALSKIGQEIQNEDLINPTITPVLDLSDVEKNAKQIGGLLNLDGPIQLASSAGLSFTGGLNNLLSNIQASIPDNTNDDVVMSINTLREDVNNLRSVIGNLQVVMDTGELVGVLATPIDQELGFYQTLNERGVR